MNHNQHHENFTRSPAEPQASRALRWQDRSLLIIAIILMALLMLRIETAHAQSPPPTVNDGDNWGLEVMTAGKTFRSLAIDTDIEVDINGLVARVRVSQRFRNLANDWAEAVYRFPLPPGAAVDAMRIETGGRVIEGEIQEKETAKRAYQQARSSGRTASLVTQQRPNQFETRLANIGPGEDVRVHISFLTRVDYRDGSFTLQLPMTFTPRWQNPAPRAVSMAWPQPSPTPIFSSQVTNDHYLTIAINLRLGMPLSQLESRHHDVDIHPTLDGYHVFLSNPDTRTDRMFELNWTPDLGLQPQPSLLTWDAGDAVYALLMLAPPLKAHVRPQARELIFVIDTSGSMEGASLVQAKSALLEGLALLGPEDSFNLVQFNSHTEILFESAASPDAASLLEASDYIQALVANGGTNMGPALSAALQFKADSGRLRQVVFITDGSVDDEADLLLQIARDLGDARLFTVAIGSAPNSWFMRKAAEIGRGNYSSIGRTQDVSERMNQLWKRIESPSLRDICVDWGMDSESYPEIIPDLYAGEPLWIIARLPHQPSDITVCGELDGQHWEAFSAPAVINSDNTIALMWARAKVDALEESRIFGLDEDVLRQEITAVALQYGLLTSYTSLVAIEHTASRPPGLGLVREAVPSLLPAGSASSVGFPGTATGWKVQLLLSLLTLLIATALFLLSSARVPMANLPSLSGRSNGQQA